MHTDLPNHPQAFAADAHRQLPVRPAVARGVDALRPGDRERRTCPASSRSSPPANNGGAGELRQRVPAGRSTRGRGSATAASRSPTPRSATSPTPGVGPAAQRLQLDFVQALNRDALEREQVNPGVEGVIESYELAFRMQGELPKRDGPRRARSEATQAAVRHRRRGDRRLRPAVPAGPAVRRGRRAVRRGEPRRLGPAPRPEGRRTAATPRAVDQPIAGLLDRPEAARPAGGHAGDLGRRVRPHAVRPERRRPRPQQQGLHASGWPAAA